MPLNTIIDKRVWGGRNAWLMLNTREWMRFIAGQDEILELWKIIVLTFKTKTTKNESEYVIFAQDVQDNIAWSRMNEIHSRVSVLNLTAESFISAADKQVQELLAIGSILEVLSWVRF